MLQETYSSYPLAIKASSFTKRLQCQTYMMKTKDNGRTTTRIFIKQYKTMTKG